MHKSNPCVFYHPGKDITIVVHGDDFTALAGDAELDWYESKLKESFEIKVRGRLGEGCKGPQQIKILNRVVTASDQGLTYEADPRHCDLLMASLNLTSTSSAASPGVKPTDRDDSAQKHDEIQTLEHLDYTDPNQVIASICAQESSPENPSTSSSIPSSCSSAGCESIYNQNSVIDEDKWHLSGKFGIWHREHKLRRMLETPCKIPNGPENHSKLSSMRLTIGKFDNETKFAFCDSWRI